jgi:multiple sugar transport system substrate-binding protein
VTIYSGLTWDHPRGYQALLAAEKKARSPDFEIRWDRQPLEGFESASIEELARRFDLIVIDHPHVGEAVKAGCLRPLEEVFDDAFIRRLDREAIGPAFSSYVYAGKSWALPLDAATQVMAVRADLLDEPSPTTWTGVEALACRKPVCLSLAGPHAILTLMSICVALGGPPADRDPDQFVGADVGRAAIDILSSIYARATRAGRELNPIGILERMTRSDDIVLCPLIYGYVNYARVEVDRAHAVTFGNAPVIAPGGRPGSTLGGTGVAVTRRCSVTSALLAHLEWLMSPATQETLIPLEAGQPGLRSAWASETVNAAWANFYRNTAETLEAAWVRPRHPGYIGFQTEASAILRAALEARANPDPTLAKLQDRYARSRAGEPK